MVFMFFQWNSNENSKKPTETKIQHKKPLTKLISTKSVNTVTKSKIIWIYILFISVFFFVFKSFINSHSKAQTWWARILPCSMLFHSFLIHFCGQIKWIYFKWNSMYIQRHENIFALNRNPSTFINDIRWWLIRIHLNVFMYLIFRNKQQKQHSKYFHGIFINL